MNNWKVNNKIYKIKTRITGLFIYPRMLGLPYPASLKYLNWFKNMWKVKRSTREFPGHPVVRIQYFHC